MNPPSEAKPTRLLVVILIVLVVANLAFLAFAGWPMLAEQLKPVPTAFKPSPSPARTLLAATITPSGDFSLTPTLEPTFTMTPTSAVVSGLSRTGVLVLSMIDGRNFRLFAYQPEFLNFSPLTNSTWDEIDPAISPDGTRIVYSANPKGNWDIFILDLTNGQTTQVTNTPQYDASPTWSPDGQWIAYENSSGSNLDIFVKSITDLAQPPIQLTNDPANDHSPRWSPKGREIAFVSNRSGSDEIWLARLDDIENRFANLSRNTRGRKSHPVWSPDGNSLAWSSLQDGQAGIFIFDFARADQPAQFVGNGDWPIWSPDQQNILTQVYAPNQSALVMYQIKGGMQTLPLTPMNGNLNGMDWKSGGFSNIVLPMLEKSKYPSASPLWQPSLNQKGLPSGRVGLAHLDGVDVPNPFLSDAVDEAFVGLRQQIASLVGWDFLNALEAAYQDPGTPSIPGLRENWLATGRAISVSPLPIHAGYMAVVREDYGGQVFWRIFLRTHQQDGSQGRPMTRQPWDFDARLSGDPRGYEQGGKLVAIPEGYWVDFTELALRYGWERQPALFNWINFYPAARFTQFVMPDSLDWNTAASQVFK